MQSNIILACLTVATLTGCASAKYSIIESEFSYEKRDGSIKYFSKKPLKIDHETGESFIMDYSNAQGYYWLPINELVSEPNGAVKLNF